VDITFKYDYLIVGCGLFGSTFARQATDAGKKCLVIDKRGHVGGNVFTENKAGIHVHKYGPHIFHTNSQEIWNYVNQFAVFNDYKHTVKASYNDQLYSFPINLSTLEELWGKHDKDTLLSILDAKRVKTERSNNLEDWILSKVGEEIYQKFFYGYTKKQWSREPRDLPASIIRRLPIRDNYDNRYHEDHYSGIPTGGYAAMMENILDGIQVELGQDYFYSRDYYDNLAKRVVYTGAIDDFFDHQLGSLDWRSLRFEEEVHSKERYQCVAQINYTDYNVGFTRIVEHKHFADNPKTNHTIITKEYPEDYKVGMEKYYPINDEKNKNLYRQYKRMIPSKYVFGGRLAEYKYYDMDQVIGSSVHKAKKELK
jgi:UDP-galactopyranose mutase